MDKFDKLLVRVGMPPHLKGYRCTKEALRLLQENKWTVGKSPHSGVSGHHGRLSVLRKRGHYEAGLIRIWETGYRGTAGE